MVVDWYYYQLGLVPTVTVASIAQVPDSFLHRQRQVRFSAFTASSTWFRPVSSGPSVIPVSSGCLSHPLSLL